MARWAVVVVALLLASDRTRGGEGGGGYESGLGGRGISPWETKVKGEGGEEGGSGREYLRGKVHLMGLRQTIDKSPHVKGSTAELMKFLTTRTSLCAVDAAFMKESFSSDPFNTQKLLDHVQHILDPSCACDDDRVAVYLLRHALRVKPDDALGWKLLADLTYAGRAYKFLRSVDDSKNLAQVEDEGDENELWSLSMQMYQRSLDFNPNNPGALKGMGDVSLNMLNNPSGAKMWYEKGLRITTLDGATRSDLLIALASAHEQLNENEEAEKMFSRAIELCPSNLNARNDFAAFFFEHGKLSKAAVLLEDLFHNEDTSAVYLNAQLCYNYALLLENREEQHKAIKVLESAFIHHPQDLDVRSKLAELLYTHSTEHARSKEILLGNLRMVPNHIPSLLSLSLLEEEHEGSLADIEALLANALELEPSNPIFLNLNARAYFLWEDFENAERLYRDAIFHSIDNPNLNSCLGLAGVLKQGGAGKIGLRRAARRMHHKDENINWELVAADGLQNPVTEARLLYEHVLAIIPHDNLALKGMAELYEECCMELDKSKEIYDLAISLQPSDASILLGAAKLSGRMGNYSNLIHLHERAAELRPLSADLMFDIANNYMEIRDLTDSQEDFADRAGQLWHRTIQLDPSHTSALYNLGLKCLNEDKASQAYHFLNSIERLDPSNYLALYEVACLHERWGNFSEAIECFLRVMECEPMFRDTPARIATNYWMMGDVSRAQLLFKNEIHRIEGIEDTNDGMKRHASTYFCYARFLESQSKYQEAMAAYDKALNTPFSQAEILAHAGYNAAVNLGKVNDGWTKLKTSICLAPQNAACHAVYSLFLAKHHMKSDAIVHYNLALKLRPSMDLAKDIVKMLREEQQYLSSI